MIPNTPGVISFVGVVAFSVAHASGRVAAVAACDLDAVLGAAIGTHAELVLYTN